MLKLIFALDRINSARYNLFSYNLFQHVFLSNLSKDNLSVFDDLLKYRFGAISLGETFSTIHGDLVTEHFNKESKRTTGPYRAGYIFRINTVNKWIAISHIYSKLRMIQRGKLRLHKSSQHKETTISDKQMRQKHDKNVKL